MNQNFVQKYEGNPILTGRGLPYLYLKFLNNWEGRTAYHPQIIKKTDQYFLFYTGTTSFQFLCYQHDIGLAVSQDLKHWTRYQSRPIFAHGAKDAWDGDLAAHSFITKKGDQYYMFYDGSPVGSWQEAIGVATSPDLIHWQRYSQNPVLSGGQFWWCKSHVSRCCIYSENDKHYMFYAGHDYHCERIGLAISDDLLHWEQKYNEPVLNIGKKSDWDEFHISDPRVIKVNDLYLMFYSGYGRGHNGKIGEGRLGLAYSKDLVNWQKFDHNPIMDIGAKGSWDSHEAARASIFQDGPDDYYLVYSGGRGINFKTGLAKLDLSSILKHLNS